MILLLNSSFKNWVPFSFFSWNKVLLRSTGFTSHNKRSEKFCRAFGSDCSAFSSHHDF